MTELPKEIKTLKADSRGRVNIGTNYADQEAKVAIIECETGWHFQQNEVLEDKNGQWWHIIHRRKCVDCGQRKYELADASHTEYTTLHAGDLEGLESEDPLMESLGWTTKTKPAAEAGFRVNGVLCGPSEVEHYKDNQCFHEHTCPECDEDSKDGIDIIHSHENGEVQATTLECRTCGHTWSRSN